MDKHEFDRMNSTVISEFRARRTQQLGLASQTP
jgi:hypothetical protein